MPSPRDTYRNLFVSKQSRCTSQFRRPFNTKDVKQTRSNKSAIIRIDTFYSDTIANSSSSQANCYSLVKLDDKWLENSMDLIAAAEHTCLYVVLLGEFISFNHVTVYLISMICTWYPFLLIYHNSPTWLEAQLNILVIVVIIIPDIRRTSIN